MFDRSTNLVLALSSVALLAYAGGTFRSASAETASAVQSSSLIEPTFAPMLERVTPAVVSIAVSGHIATERSPLSSDPFFRRFFNIPEQPSAREMQAAGSGVIVDADGGYILTNNHLVQHADKITAVLSDGRRLDADLVGTDPDVDIAVIHVHEKRLTSIPLGDSEKLRVGDWVLAIGNPFGLNESATHGIVSALGRSGIGIGKFENFIQTDAPINPGNSGGALVNLKGELVGINTAIAGPTGSNVGISFAIPIEMARKIMRQLIDHGEVRRGQLGVLVQNLSPELASQLGVDARAGVVVAKVFDGSAAEKAGLQSEDVILSVDGSPVKSSSDLQAKIGMTPSGRTIKLEILRKGRKMTIEATIASDRKVAAVVPASTARA